MQCYVYRSAKRVDTYLFITQKDDFSVVPEDLLRVFGTPEFSLEFELTEERKLAQSDPEQVRAHLSDQGYFLQIPPAEHITV